MVDFSKQSSESVALDEVTSSLDNHCLGRGEPEDQQALMERQGEDGQEAPVTHSSPRAEKGRLNLDASFSNCSLTRSRSRESFYSVRRASSVDDIEAMKGESDKARGHSRHASTGSCRGEGEGVGGVRAQCPSRGWEGCPTTVWLLFFSACCRPVGISSVGWNCPSPLQGGL